MKWMMGLLGFGLVMIGILIDDQTLNLIGGTICACNLVYYASEKKM